MELTTKRYQSISYISGPLLFVEGAKDLAYGAIVNIHLPDETVRGGQVIEVSEKNAVIQVFEETTGLDLAKTSISLREDVARLGVSKEMIGRRFSGLGEPIDGLPPLIPEKRLPIIGAPINPVARQRPQEFIQTGISAIDGLNTLVRGQKLPIFSGAGLPHNEIAAQIARQAKVLGSQEQFSVVFAAMGITQREAAFFIDQFESTGALARSVVFLNLADDPAIERLITPRVALTAAEFLALEMDMQVLVILSDMTNYCERMREIGALRDQLYSAYANGVDLRKLVAIIGEEALTDRDRLYLKFSEEFERRFLNQGQTERSIEDTLTLAWRLLSTFPKGELKRVKQDHIEKYYFGDLMEETWRDKTRV